MSRVLITTVPFGDKDRSPIDKLENAGIDYVINPIGRKLTEQELADMIGDFDILIAGTECISKTVLQRAKNLKFISRVGIGLDSVDLIAAQERGIKVSYTPDAPAPAVAELTIGLMLSLLRSIHLANNQLHKGHWHRYFGRRISEVTIGVIGLGRIGTRVLGHLSAFGSPRILVNDLTPNLALLPELNLQWVDKEIIYSESDVITLHVPLTSKTTNMIKRDQMLKMKKDAVIINTARGGIINEHDLVEVLNSGYLSGAAIDVFDNEPYSGRLANIERCILTSHMGSMSIDCRTSMEIEATEEVIRFSLGHPLKGQVPNEEYYNQMLGG